VVLVLSARPLVTKLSVLVPRHIQEILLSLVVLLPRLTCATLTPVAPMPSVSQEWTILQERTGLCVSVKMDTEVMESQGVPEGTVYPCVMNSVLITRLVMTPPV